MKMFERLQPVQKREAGVTANVMLSLIDRIKGDVSSLSRRCSEFQADAYNTHGRFALDEGTEESARRAVAHFENQLEVGEAIGDAEGIAIANANIAYAKSMYEGGNNNEEILKTSLEFYKLRVAEFGEEHELTIDAGLQYATVLQNANRWGEAMELLMKLLAMSKQVLGPHHNITKYIESTLE
jgi:hypothetical protein